MGGPHLAVDCIDGESSVSLASEAGEAKPLHLAVTELGDAGHPHKAGGGEEVNQVGLGDAKGQVPDDDPPALYLQAPGRVATCALETAGLPGGRVWGGL